MAGSSRKQRRGWDGGDRPAIAWRRRPKLDSDQNACAHLLGYSTFRPRRERSGKGGVIMSQAKCDIEIATAASAVLISLLRTLVDGKLLSNRDVRAVLSKAVADLPSHEFAAPAKGAAGIILNDWLPRFPEDGGD
jgi:hypothetical protein